MKKSYSTNYLFQLVEAERLNLIQEENIDYRAIENQALAHANGDAGTRAQDEAFMLYSDGDCVGLVDIHRERAAEEYGVHISQVTQTMRNKGKRLNYIELYSNPLPIQPRKPNA